MSSNEQLLRVLLIIVAVVLLVPFLLMAIMMPAMGMWGWGHMGDVGMWGGAGWMWLLMWLIVLAVVLGLGYLLYRGIRRTDGRSEDVALEELRVAYARGELSDEEFETRRERLQRED
ncbi:SHOCT domain-containing protein [Halobellus ruber]|uniref:SHOCT domain-containing protein n=1 Tax=Halobellus ruber TaxID=2761102 RepID=A0A7J9SLM6_9EURY|nr:SHOCT domain-containing protein [Halobellus ruber]MBB6646926.1 SHOCT domain-containing protein [Halobellus ruber]